MVDAHLADQLQAVAHRVRRPFEDAADQVRPAVADGQADPAALGVGVEVRGPLARQVGQEEQPLGARAGQRGLVGQQEIRVDPRGLRRLDLAPGRAGCGTTGTLPPAASTTPITRHAPRDGVAAALEPAQRVEAGLGRVGEDDARGPHRGRDDPRPDDPVAHRPRRLVAAAADDRRPGRQARRLGPDRADRRRDLGALEARRAGAPGRGRACRAARGSIGGWPRRAGASPRRR